MLCRSCADSGSKRKPKNDTNQSGIPTQQEERPPKQTLLFVVLALFEGLTAYLPLLFRRGIDSVFVSLQTLQV